MKRQTFEKYLEEDIWVDNYSDGVLDDDMEDAFNGWVETLDVADIIEYAEGYGIKMYELGEKVGFPKDTDEYDSRLQMPNEAINVLTERN